MLKESKKKQHDPKKEIYINNINSDSENENTASASHRGQQENVQLIPPSTSYNKPGKLCQTLLQLKQILIKFILNKESEDFWRGIKHKIHFINPEKKARLLNKTYSENQQTKRGFQVTIPTVFRNIYRSKAQWN